MELQLIATLTGQTLGCLLDPLVWIFSYLVHRRARTARSLACGLVLVIAALVTLRSLASLIDPALTAISRPSWEELHVPGAIGATLISFAIIRCLSKYTPAKRQDVMTKGGNNAV